ncbi:MAG: dihydropteroate synthase [Gammaproteobacteria bacterium]|nr:dihydropteroate synthase [Gammaproteobacteria bacterium]MDH3769171.1 dihydropteroate synthase [Gammaproteobacteria bacterium]
MGVLNVTPDSFSDGGQFAELDSALAHAQRMYREGATLIDVGGESTRPGSRPVDVERELERVIPVVEYLRDARMGLISVDTSKAEVMRAAIDSGAHMINDVNALRDEQALATCADSDVAVCLMHMQGEPRTMQEDPYYDDVLNDVITFLRERIDACVNAGISRDRIVIDPGFGFGKTLEHNFSLLRGIEQICQVGQPVLAGLSRKSMLGALLDRSVGERLAGSLALATLAASRGVSIIRAHDVAETVDAMQIVGAVTRGH